MSCLYKIYVCVYMHILLCCLTVITLKEIQKIGFKFFYNNFFKKCFVCVFIFIYILNLKCIARINLKYSIAYLCILLFRIKNDFQSKGFNASKYHY